MQLPTEAHARTTDPDTSKAAAKTVLTSKHQKIVLAAATAIERDNATWDGSFTLEDLVAEFAWLRRIGKAVVSDSGIRTRAKELRVAGYLEWVTNDEGDYMTAETKSGRQARLLRVTKKGWAA